MLGALIIVFREVIEAGLIVGIVMAVTKGMAGTRLVVALGILAGLVGAETEVFGAYDGFGLQSFQGEALYIGPTLQIQFTGQIMLAAAWSSEVAGHANGEHYGLDLTNFPQQRGNLKLEFEF